MIKKFKKIISVTLAGVMMIGLSTFAAETNTASVYVAKPEKAYVLEKLGVMQSKEESVYSQSISRGDFAYSLGKLLIQNGGEESTRYFADVADYDYAAPYINALVEMKVISVDEERRFYPERSITIEEAVKMIVAALGYSPLAQAKGGYPMGYMRIAEKGGLLDGVNLSSAGEVTWAQTAELLFNTLIEPQYIPTEISNGGEEITYVQSEKDTVLKEVYSMEYARGILTGSNGVDIAFDVTSDKDSVVADGIRCTIDGENEDYTKLLGKSVYVLYYSDNDKAYYIFEDSSNKTEELIINTEDIAGYGDGNIKYYAGEKVKIVNISKAIILYNNAVPKNNIKSLFDNLICGSVRLVKTGSDGYNAAIISDCKPFVLKFADATSESLYSESDDTSIKLNEYETVNIKDEKGSNLALADIAAKSVMNVYASQNKERIDITVSSASVDGVAKAVSTADRSITLDGKVYDIEKGFERSVLGYINVGNTVQIYLDEFGKAIYAKVLDSAGMTTGYLITAYTDDSVFDDKINFKIYTASGELAIYESAENINIDGQSYRSAGAKALAAIPNGGNTQIIRFGLNSDKKINVIDTYEPGNETQDTTLTRIKDGSAYSSKYSFRIGKDIVVSSDTKFFCVPQDEDVLSATADKFSIVKQNNFNNAVNFKFEVYKEKGKNEFADAVVYRVNPDDSEENDYLNSNMFLVSENIEAIDDNGDAYRQLNGMLKGRDTSLKVYEDSLDKTNMKVDDIAEGDLIRYRTAYNGNVSAIEVLYDFSENKRIGWKNDNETMSLFASNYNSNFQISFGYVSEKGDNVVGWGYKSGANTDERINALSTSITFYDKDSRESKVYKGSINEIKDYKSAGDECDMIFVQFNQGYIQAAVVYKR